MTCGILVRFFKERFLMIGVIMRVQNVRNEMTGVGDDALDVGHGGHGAE
jgi:hypothetical protein